MQTFKLQVERSYNKTELKVCFLNHGGYKVREKNVVIRRTFKTVFYISLAEMRVFKDRNLLTGREDGRKITKGKRNGGMQA